MSVLGANAFSHIRWLASRSMHWQISAGLHALRIGLKQGFAAQNHGTDINDDLAASEYRIFSQNGEDGILDRVFREIGFTNRVFCEFGFSTFQSNAIRLVQEHGFTGRWIDGNARTCAVARLVTRLCGWPGVEIVQAFIDRENINQITAPLCGTGGVAIDLLSIDLDGVDYWIFEQLEAIRPRVLVMEYNAVFGPDRAVTVPYDATFERFSYHRDGCYFGASLTALERLAARKGYRLLGTELSGTNAFFIDAALDAPTLCTVTARKCWRPMQYWIARGRPMADCFHAISALPLTEV